MVGIYWSLVLFLGSVQASLLAHYEFNANQPRLDSSGNGHDITQFDSVSLASDRFGFSNSAVQTGGGSSIVVSSFGSLAIGSQMTVSLWFMKTSNGDNQYMALANTGYSDLFPLFDVRMNNANGQLFGGVRSSATLSPGVYSDWTAPLNQWAHVAMTADAARGTLSVYVNGQLRQQLCSLPNDFNLPATGEPLRIGFNTNPSTREEFYGVIDDVRIYDTALDAQQVQGLCGGWGACVIQPQPEANDPNLFCDARGADMLAFWPLGYRSYFDDMLDVDMTADVSSPPPSLTSNRHGVPQAAYDFTRSPCTSATWDEFRNQAWPVQFSVSLWFKRTSGVGGYMAIANVGYGNGAAWDIRMGDENGGTKFNLLFKDSDGTFRVWTTLVALDQWHHVVFAWDGSQTGSLQAWVDGTLIQTECNLLSKTLASINEPLRLGWNTGQNTPGECLQGSIDEVRLFNRTLRQQDVDDLCDISGCAPEASTAVTQVCGIDIQPACTGPPPSWTASLSSPNDPQWMQPAGSTLLLLGANCSAGFGPIATTLNVTCTAGQWQTEVNIGGGENVGNLSPCLTLPTFGSSDRSFSTASSIAVHWTFPEIVAPSPELVSGDNALVFAVSPSLPSGLIVNQTSGDITGYLPVLPTSDSEFSVTASNQVGVQFSTSVTLHGLRVPSRFDRWCAIRRK